MICSGVPESKLFHRPDMVIELRQDTHDCMSCELVNDRLKEMVREQLDKMQKTARRLLFTH
jgi:hypothetical protein